MHAEKPRDLTYFGDVLRVVLRPEGCARYFGVAFLLVWIGGWAVGEAFAINMLLAFLGVDFRAPFPVPISKFGVGWPSLFPIVFLLVWLTFWTWGGVGAIGHVLRLLFGQDTIEVSPSQWRAIRSYGFFRMTRTYARSDGWSAEMRQRDKALMARHEDKRQLVTTLGTPAERRWLANEIVRVFGTPKIRSRDLPKEFEAVRDGDGVEIRSTARSRRGAFGCGLFAILIVDVPLIMWLMYSAQRPPTGGLVVLASLALLASAFGIWAIFARQYRVLKRDYFAEHLVFPGIHRKWECSGGTLELESRTDSDGDEHFTLFVTGGNGRKKRLYASMHEPDEPLLLGRFIEKHTGWRLVVPHTVVSS